MPFIRGKIIKSIFLASHFGLWENRQTMASSRIRAHFFPLKWRKDVERWWMGCRQRAFRPFVPASHLDGEDPFSHFFLSPFADAFVSMLPPMGMAILANWFFGGGLKPFVKLAAAKNARRWMAKGHKHQQRQLKVVLDFWIGTSNGKKERMVAPKNENDGQHLWIIFLWSLIRNILILLT